jgi:hypothetical protein
VSECIPTTKVQKLHYHQWKCSTLLSAVTIESPFDNMYILLYVNDIQLLKQNPYSSIFTLYTFSVY